MNLRYSPMAVAGDSVHTNQKAELTAVIRALQLIRLRKIPCGAVSVFTDSKYAVQGLNEWIPRWRGNGYRTSKNHGVANADLFRSLDYEVSLLMEQGTFVKLTHVPRDTNREADALSKSGARAVDNADPLQEAKEASPGMLLGREVMVKTKPLVQWTPDGHFWASHEPISGAIKAYVV